MSTEKKVLSQSDITMLKVYYYFRDNPDKLNEELPKTITRPDVADDSTKVYSVSSDNWKFLKGINKDGSESKVGAILGFKSEDSSIKLNITGAKSRAEISKRRIDRVLKDIEEGNYELSDISFGSRIITVEEQKDFLKLLDDSLKEYIEKELVDDKKKDDTSKKDNYKISIGSSKNITDNTIHLKTDNDSDELMISSIARILNLKINIENINCKIKYLLEVEHLSEEDAAVVKLQDDLKKLIIEKDGLEEKLKEKWKNEDISEEYTSLIHIIDMQNEIIENFQNKIKQIEAEIEKLDSQIESFDESKKSTPEGSKEYNKLVKQKQNLAIKRVGLVRALKICTEEKDKYKSMLKDKTQDEERETDLDYDERDDTYIHDREIEESTPNPTPSGQELQPVEKNRQPYMMLGYYDLNLFDKFRAKIEAYKKINRKEPNVLRKLTLFFPSFKYSSAASQYIGNGEIDLNDVIGNMNKYKKAIIYEEERKESSPMDLYRVDRTPRVENNNHREEEHDSQIEEEDIR